MNGRIKKLIAEARKYVSDHDAYADNHLLRDLADALDAEHKRAEGYRIMQRETAKAARGIVAERDSAIATGERILAESWGVARERDALRAAAQTGHIHVRGVLEKLDSYSWHAHDSGFVTSTRTSALSAFEALSRAIDTKDGGA